MTAQHYFLNTAQRSEPLRWRETFPQGLALDAERLLQTLQGGNPLQRMVWLSTQDVQWHAHLAQLLKAQSAERVVLLSSVPDEREGLRALNEGAAGYAHAYAVPELFEQVALVVQNGGLWVGPQLMQRLISGTSRALTRRRKTADDPAAGAEDNSAWASLSESETRVVRAVMAGHSNKEAADMLHISERTVKAHLGAVFEKLGVRDRLQLVLRLTMGVLPQTKAQP
ncbi:MAG: LuxR C-terminal-related transcriptional regulator [Burkholderiaceae bacterium]